MASAYFDTLTISRRLRDTGASEKVAGVVAHSFAEAAVANSQTVASKADVERLDAKVDLVAERLAKEIERAQNCTITWMGGMIVAALGIVFAILKA